ncbi:MAG: DUF1460 domain-containing protein [Cyanobacteria bacterium SZAS TMP-1]|nr:DUF1460 domain-containing protein [Cyanobacteria bacterium SZAS TMP-1]
MQTRRLFIANLLATLGALSCGQQPASAGINKVFRGEGVLNRITSEARRGNWQKLPIGELMGKVAHQLLGTEYVANTLDGDLDHEYCSVNLTALDCVTFFESALCIARMLKKGGDSAADLLPEVTYTRYRGGVVGDYSSRLHYTSDWFYDNQKKGVVQLLNFPVSQVITPKVGYMSDHQQSYKQLAAHKSLIAKIKKQEEDINKRPLSYVPIKDMAAMESMLKTGDIVGICTSQPGIDISHTGLVLVNEKGVPQFADASSKARNMKVVIEPDSISTALSYSKSITGAMFARPLEPR